jgi:hypothetical protein
MDGEEARREVETVRYFAEFVTPDEDFAVVGARVADNGDIEVGERITVAANSGVNGDCRAVAILESHGFASPVNADRTVFAPIPAFDSGGCGQVILQVDPQASSVETETREVEQWFDDRGPTVDGETVQYLLGAVASGVEASLLAGGYPAR